MNARARNNATGVWLLLMALTLGSWLVGSHLLGPRLTGIAVTALILSFSLFKAWLVVEHFMEVRHAPRPLRIASAVWLTVLFGSLLWMLR